MAAVRQQINIAAPTRAVWEALTTPEGLASWWVDGARVEARKGGVLVLQTEDDEGNPVEERGMFHDFRVTRRFEVAFERTSQGPWAGTRLSVQVARDGSETRVAVVHSGIDDDEANEALDKEWKAALKALRSSLED